MLASCGYRQLLFTGYQYVPLNFSASFQFGATLREYLLHVVIQGPRQHLPSDYVLSTCDLHGTKEKMENVPCYGRAGSRSLELAMETVQEEKDGFPFHTL